MSLLQNSNAITPSGYDIDNSCRFNEPDSPYLSRTPASASNRKTWTISCWAKLTGHDNGAYFMDAGSNPNYVAVNIYQGSIRIYDPSVAPDSIYIATTRLLRDLSAWYHIVVQLDTTQATNTDRVKIYVNNERATEFTNTVWPAQNYDSFINNNIEHTINKSGSVEGAPYMAEYHFIDGTALTPSSFAEADEDTNQWKAIKYAGSYGTNGFFLEFQNSAALGTDTSGEGNTWASTNLVATDQMIDTPQNSTGGNWSTLNPLNNRAAQSASLSEGNLKLTPNDGSNHPGTATIGGMQSGKWYMEYYINSASGSSPVYLVGGVVDTYSSIQGSIHDGTSGMPISRYMNGLGEKGYTNRNVASYGSALATGDYIGMAVDLDNGAIYWAIDNSWQNGGDPTSGASKTGAAFTDIISAMPRGGWTMFLEAAFYSGNVMTANFGQDSSFAGAATAQNNTDANDIGDFYYAPPSGYLALCTDNLADPSIALPGAHFNTILFADGAGAKTGVGFQPDLVWLKARSVGGVGDRYKLTDNVRGVTKGISSNSIVSGPWTTVAESTDSTGLTAFGADGFTVGADAYYSSTTGTGMVAWNWLGANTTASNTSGTITSTVSANTTSGFSICGYTGSGNSASTFGHGLSVAPEYVMVKNRDTTDDWAVYNIGLTSATYWLEMNDEVGEASGSTIWNSTAPTATLVHIGSSNNTNKTGDNHIAYCFHSVEGYSKIATFTGTGNVDGPFIYCGFRPAWVLVKEVNGSGDWLVNDSARDGFNPNNRDLGIWRYDPSSGGGQFDQLSNGLKVRTTAGNTNADGQRMVVLIFAESPFKFSNAR